MASSYPNAFDNLSTSHADGIEEKIHASTVNDLADAVNKMQTELGTNPRGSSTDVKTRISAIEIPVLNTQTGTTYTLVLSDANKIVGMSNAAANTLTIPPNSSVAFTVGTVITLRQVGAGQTNVSAGAGVTLNSRGSLTHLAGQFAYASLVKVGTDTWELSGDLA